MPQPLLSGGEQEYVHDDSALRSELEAARRENRRLDEALRLERNKVGQVESGVRELRRTLNPLYRALQAIYGDIDAMGIQESTIASSSQDSHKQAAWDAWKARLGVPCAKIISALQVHRSMNQTQMSIATGITRNNIPTYIFRINKAGLINKNGNEYSLKEL